MKQLILLVSLLATTLTWGAKLTGSVLTDTQMPVVNAVVSDGFSVVTTDNNGAYSMPYNPAAKYVFVSMPSGYDFPTDEGGSPKIWQAINKAAALHVHNFTLHPCPDGGKADSAHVLLVFGDPQVLNAYDMWRFKNETVEDVKQLIASYPAGTRFIGITVGDIVWDEYAYFPSQKTTYETLGFPNFMTIGNHDHNASAPKQSTQALQDSIASLKFEAVFGPTYYSFNVGAMHYVVLDNVYYKGNATDGKGYTCALTDQQRNWLKKDLAMVKKGTQVVYAMHINATNNTSDLQLMQSLVDTLGCTNYIISGHVHTNTVTVQKSNFIEHNIGACQGSFWACDWCADGSPNGYKVFETSPSGIANWYYKGTGWNEDFRITTFPVGSIDAGNSKQNSVLANVWDYTYGETVQIRENGGELKNMTKFTADGKDPDLYDLMLDDGDARPNYPGAAGGTIASKNPGAKGTKHLFSYKPKIENSSLEVVYTDRFGKVTTAPILKHMMVASFSHDETYQWSYLQDFNSLPSYPNYSPSERRGTWVAGHTPKGWYAAYQKNDNTWAGYDWLHIDDGGQNNASVKSFGSVSNAPSENGRERSLGSLNMSSQQRISYGVIIENNTGATITSLDVTYTGEVWRVGASNTATESLKFSYAILTDEQARKIRDRAAWIGQIATTDVPALQFTTPSTLTAIQAGQTKTKIDGNDPNNQQVVNGKIQLTLGAGQVVLLRWDDDRMTTDMDQALAIDDVQIVPDFSTGLSDKASSSLWNHSSRIVLKDGHVFILTDQDIYSITGQKH